MAASDDIGLDDERCPFFWWARSVAAGEGHAGWPILWLPRFGALMHRYAGVPVPLVTEVRDGARLAGGA